MIYIKVLKEVKEYEGKILFGFSARQLIFGSISIGLSLSIYMLITPLLGQSLSSYIVMIVAMPFFCCGFIDIHGMPFEKYCLILLKFYTRNQKIYYSDEYRFWNQNKLIKISKKEKKKRKKLDEFADL